MCVCVCVCACVHEVIVGHVNIWGGRFDEGDDGIPLGIADSSS